jgi:hypothetical protein
MVRKSVGHGPRETVEAGDMARIQNNMQTPIYGAISRKDLPNAPRGTGGYEIIKIDPGEKSPEGLDVDWVTNEAPKNENGTLKYDKETGGFKIRDTWGVDTGQVYEFNKVEGGIGISGPSGGGSWEKVKDMNSNFDMDDDNGFDVRTYPGLVDKIKNFFN